MHRVVVTFRGRVQGVGFRQTAVEISERFVVTGTVENLPNGDVQLVAEGDLAEIEAFIVAIEKRMARNIEKIVRRNEPPSGEFDTFSVLR